MNKERQQVADQVHSSALHLVRAVRSLDSAMGLSTASASAMSVLVFGGPMTVGELARVEGVRSPTMTSIINGLERAGLAKRQRMRGDGRQVRVAATAAGRRLLQRGRQRRVEALAAALGQATAEDLRALRRAAAIMERAADAVRLTQPVTPTT